MWTHIVLTIIVVTIAGAAFGITSHLLGRGDKRPGCGRGDCGACKTGSPNPDCTAPLQSDEANEDRNTNDR